MFSQSDIEIIVATMHRRNLHFLNEIFPHHDLKKLQILVVNQTDFEPLLSDFPNIRVINTDEKGLSNSRNLGIKNARTEIVLLTDDDVVFDKVFLETVLDGFSLHKNATAIKFRTKGLDGNYFKKYSEKPRTQLSDLDILSTMSIELVYNLKHIKSKGLKFNILFGLGTDFPLGEEQLFLKLLKNKGLEVAYFPKTIVFHPEHKNSDIISFSQYWTTIGAIYSEMFRKTKYIWLLILLFFKIKKGGLSIKKLFPAIAFFNKGAKKYSAIKHT